MGGWNYCALLVGLPEAGKTTLLRQIARAHLANTNGIVLAEDPLKQFVRKDGFAFFESAQAWRNEAWRCAKGQLQMARACSIGGDSESIVRLAIEVGGKLNHDEHVRLPILVPCDEGSLRSGSGSTWVGKLDNEFLVTRRHRGLGPVLNVQEVHQLMRRFWGLATDVYLFRQPGQVLQTLDDYLQLERGTLADAGLNGLPPFHYLHVKPGRGVVAEAL